MSNRVTSENTIGIYEEWGTETDPQERTLTVISHWNRDDFVVLRVDGHEYTVVASDLKAAIANATNVR